jgi:hypothetical protein
MIIPGSGRSATRAALITAVGTLLLTGCALIQPPPVPQVPRLRLLGGHGDAGCTAHIAQAHAAFATAGAAAGDPAATASAHASAASAMSAYHTCLAQPTRR